MKNKGTFVESNKIKTKWGSKYTFDIAKVVTKPVTEMITIRSPKTGRNFFSVFISEN